MNEKDERPWKRKPQIEREGFCVWSQREEEIGVTRLMKVVLTVKKKVLEGGIYRQ